MAEKWRKYHILVLSVIILTVYLFLQFLCPLLAPILTAMLFVTMFGPFLKKVQNRLKIHRQIGVILLLLMAGTVLFVILWLLFSWLASSLPDLTKKLESLEQQLIQLLQNTCELAGRTIGIDSSYLQKMLAGSLQEGFGYFREEALPGILSHSMGYVKKIASAAGFLVTFLIAAVLLAKDYDAVMNKMLDLEECHVFLEVVCGVIRYIATYVKAQLTIMAIIGILTSFVLLIVGIPQGGLWGILAGILDAFPFVGTGIVLIPLAIAQFVNRKIGQGVVCLILYGCCAFLRELLEPRLIGKKVGVHPVYVLVSVYAGIGLFGGWGIIKGPLGFILIFQTYQSLQRRWGSRVITE